MSTPIPGTITGTAQTGLTSPTYTCSADTPPNVNSRQSAITALGGTQSGVNTHTVSKPFTVTVTRPAVFSVLGKPNPVTGLISSFPRNTTKVLTRKGVLPIAGQPNQIMIIRTEIEMPAGADTADAPNVRAALSAHIGLLANVSAGLGDTLIDGIL